MGLAAWISASARVRLLRSAWWCDQAQFFHDHLKVFPGLFLLARIAQQESRVIGYGKLGSAEVVPAAAQLGHGRIDGEQRLGSHSAEGHDCLGLDDLDLAKQVGRAGFAFFALGGAIARGTALDDVGDVNVLAAESHRLDHVIQQLSGATDEWLALYVFVGTGSFADEHQISARIANAKDNLFAALFMQRTAGAIAEVFPDKAQGGAGIGGWFGGLDRLGVPACADTLVPGGGSSGSDRARTGGIERNRVGNRAAVEIVNAKIFVIAETLFERTA